jgi:hypothetical protein
MVACTVLRQDFTILANDAADAAPRFHPPLSEALDLVQGG